MTASRVLASTLAGAALFLAGSVTHRSSAATSTPHPKLSIRLTGADGASVLTASGSDLGGYRYQLGAHILKPFTGGGRFTLHLSFHDAHGKQTGQLAYKATLTPR